MKTQTKWTILMNIFFAHSLFSIDFCYLTIFHFFYFSIFASHSFSLLLTLSLSSSISGTHRHTQHTLSVPVRFCKTDCLRILLSVLCEFGIHRLIVFLSGAYLWCYGCCVHEKARRDWLPLMEASDPETFAFKRNARRVLQVCVCVYLCFWLLLPISTLRINKKKEQVKLEPLKSFSSLLLFALHVLLLLFFLLISLANGFT